MNQTSITMGALLLLLGLVVLGYFSYLAMGEVEQSDMDIEMVTAEFFAPLVPMTIGGVAVEASVAATPEERRRGLSNTPFLPPDVVKLFVFDEPGEWGFWMRDMSYPIDIIWLDEAGEVVHIEAAVHPDTYPETFTPDVPALYVVETEAGFVAEHDIQIGTAVDLPAGL